ncbi:MAG: hypothetical protein AAFU54_16490 [Chloroflexota bacterium]
MLRQITPYLPYFPYIVGGAFVLSVLLLLLAAYNLRRRRTALVWRQRHDAGKLGGRLLFTGVTMLFSSVIIGVFSGVVIYAFDYTDEFFPPRNPYGLSGVALQYIGTPTVDPTTAVPTETATQTHTPPPTASPTMTSTPPPPTDIPATQTPLPTAPPTEPPPTEMPATAVAAVGGPQQPVSNADANASPTITPRTVAGVATQGAEVTRVPASIEIVSAADTIADGAPQQMATRIFDPGITRLYFYVEYDGMDNGSKWSRILYRDGAPVGGGAYVWSLGQNGESYFVFSNQDGFAAGNYEVRVFVNNRVVQTFQFEIASGAPSRAF